MHHRGLKVAMVAVFTLVLVFGFAGIAQAQWSDLTLSTLGDYGITEAQVAAISDGFTDGTWKPYMNMPRKQFVKMAVDAYQIPLVNPATPSYSDVPASHDYYMYVEAATAAGLTNGVGGGKFDPEGTITREQAAAIIVRWVAAKNGYDLDTMYTAAEAAAILAAFPDASAVGPSLVNEMAFAVDFGIVWGDATGMLAPKKAVTRIQGAAMLIRSWGIIPADTVVPHHIELVSTDEAENLIGLTHQYTFKVSQEDGSAAPGVLVDFDTLMDVWFVGNIQPQAALTDEDGMVTVNLISTEIGVQRISAAAGGVPAMWATKYWVALDEVYLLDLEHWAQNNAGVEHTWEARVTVYGPGPLSTSRQDFYNAIDSAAYADALAALAAGEGYAPSPFDGVERHLDNYADELAIVPWVPRSLAGIPVYAEIDDETADATITEAEHDGDIAADGKSAWMYTDADGHVYITLNSTVAGWADVSFMADYAGNPYEGLLVDRDIYGNTEDHVIVDAEGEDIDYTGDWEMQPTEWAWATKVWIPHVFGDNDTIIDPSYTYANIGEEFILTATLEDVYGNPIAGRQVEWFMQGIGHFVTDDENTVTDPTDPAGNKDIDVTDANGQARVMVKSLDAGEQIVHVKFRDKGIGGMEGQFMTFDAEVQWFDVDVVTFDDPATELDNEALAWNPVGTDHEFTLHVYGLKLEMDPSIDNPQQQTPYIDTDYPGRSYDGVIDAYDAAYFGGIFLVNAKYGEESAKTLSPNGGYWVTVQGRELWVDVSTGISAYDWDDDGYAEPFMGQTGIYLPLAGKDVTFARANMTGLDLSNLGEYFDGMEVDAVGTFTPVSAVTDENGEATVTVSSDDKGPETIEATVDWEHNPHNMSELVQAYAKKGWYAEDEEVKIVVSIDETVVADNQVGEIATPINPMYDVDGIGGLGSAHIEVHVYDQFGNDLPDYEVVYLLENIGTLLPGSQGADDTYLPYAYFIDLDESDDGYDMNGSRPDADEPTPSSDPYATIVGPGGTEAFYFNQWLGAAVPGSAEAWRKNTDYGHPGWIRGVITDLGLTRANAHIDGPPFGPYAPLMTDGAKAWTLDGFIDDDGLRPNEHTGSHIDIQLAWDPRDPVIGNPDAGHYKSIVKVMVYAPADGVVIDQAPIWHYQVHKVWEAPEVTSIVLAPDTALNPVWYGGFGPQLETDALGVVATVFDQWGDPMPNVSVDLYGYFQEGDAGFAVDYQYYYGTYPTDANGQIFVADAGPWGVWNVQATADGVMSNMITIQWGDNVSMDYVGTDLILWSGYGVDLHGKTFKIHIHTPDGTIINTGDLTTYNNNLGNIVGTSYTFTGGETVWVEFAGPSNTDGSPNWVYGMPAAPPPPPIP